MSVFYGKVIELQDIEQHEGQYGMRIRLSAAESFEYVWAIDNATAESLLAIVDFDGIHKYRLSRHTVWDANRRQYIGYITKTRRDQSIRYPFVCSEAFIHNLNAVQRVQHLDEIHALPFLSLTYAEREAETLQEEEEPGRNQQKKHKRQRLPMRRVAITALSMLSILLLGSFDALSLPVAESPGASAFTAGTALPAFQSVRHTAAMAEASSNPAPKKLESEPRPKVSSEPKLRPQAELKPQTELKQQTGTRPQTELPSFELKDAVTYSLPKGYVALTFDDGPSKYSAKIMKVLKEHQVGGTFFFVGENVGKHPAAVRAIQESGYSIGSHSMNHANMPLLAYEEQEAQIKSAAESIEAITKQPVTLFRPPYGAFNEMTEEASRAHGSSIVLWNKDPEDWLTRDKDKILHYVRHTEPSGSIILLHESQAVIDALPSIIAYLKDQNLKIVSLQ
ncbi:polysaccharide deacetylase family protein [Paenibacillus sp. FSL K6-1566]|uniref:polysaccharide deacetylase family protein n=1 Tax=Paenibacillus TaxID=44249 RepID=UPI00203B3801|nr:polysaccharide deacetylase family protein [Paenibacillus lactis]MCM3493776.1 polysaccharide deacetylase family protein [Paenibacillus lactis]